MSKELNILQAIEMPVGTEFKVIYKNGLKNTIKTVLDGNRSFIKESDGYLECTTYNFVTAKFIPIQKPVSFIEAVKSGHRIKVEHNLIEDILLNKEDGYFVSNSSYNREAIERFRNKELMPVNYLFFALGYLFDESEIAEIITDGKWYIEEE